MDTDVSTLHFLYSVSGFIITLLYIPQLMNVIKTESDLKEISIMTWGAWAVCMIVSAMYSIVVVKDWKLAAVAIGGALFCSLIASVTTHKRFKYRVARIR